VPAAGSPIVVVRVIKQKTSAAVIIINLVLTFDFGSLKLVAKVCYVGVQFRAGYHFRLRTRGPKESSREYKGLA